MHRPRFRHRRQVTDNFVYKAFGESVVSNVVTVNPFRYVGRLGYYFDPDLLEFYVRARCYSPALARFFSIDPLLAQTAPYAYVANTPTNYVDPSGEQFGEPFPPGNTRSIEGVVLKRINLDFLAFIGLTENEENEDGFGHWWIVIDKNTSYGWYPDKPITPRQALVGVPGAVNPEYARKEAEQMAKKLGRNITLGPDQDPHHYDTMGVQDILPRFDAGVGLFGQLRRINYGKSKGKKCCDIGSQKNYSAIVKDCLKDAISTIQKDQMKYKYQVPSFGAEAFNCRTFQTWLAQQCCIYQFGLERRGIPRRLRMPVIK